MPSKTPGYNAQWYARNRDAQLAKNRAYYAANREKYAERQKTRELPTLKSYVMRLKRCYGLSVEQFAALFAEQRECCAVCGRHESVLSRRLVVDHNHDTNRVRGLLCDACNIAVGMLETSGATPERVRQYLKRAE